MFNMNFEEVKVVGFEANYHILDDFASRLC